MAADALSRCFFAAWSCPKSDWLELLKVEIEKDEHLSEINRQCNGGDTHHPNFTCRNGILL